MKGWILILAAVILTGAAVYVIRPPDLETVQAKRRTASTVLSKAEKDLSEWLEEARKFQDMADMLFAQYRTQVVLKDKVEKARDLAFAPEEIEALETKLAEEIRAMGEDLAAWALDGNREILNLENLQAELARTPPEKAEDLEQKIEASEKKCEQIAEVLEEATRDIAAAREVLGR
ncbi:MAG: hypothetical protein ACYS47_18755 [Planctomycetota bacterium]